MILAASTKSIRFYLAGAATTELPFTASFIDRSSAGAFTPDSVDGTSNDTTPVTLLSGPSSGSRELQDASIYNIDNVPHTVTLELLNNATARTMFKVVLELGESLRYYKGVGWAVWNSQGAPKAAGLVANQSRFLRGVMDAANLTATLTLTSGSTFFAWLGLCPAQSTSVTLRYRVTTLAATITWAELGIYRGSVNLGGNPTLTRLGTLDISGVINSTGQKTSTVTLSTAAQAGDDLWAAIGNQATTAGVIRGALADDLQTGVYAVQSSYRPSTGASPNTMTIAGATAALPWITGYVN